MCQLISLWHFWLWTNCFPLGLVLFRQPLPFSFFRLLRLTSAVPPLFERSWRSMLLPLKGMFPLLFFFFQSRGSDSSLVFEMVRPSVGLSVGNVFAFWPGGIYTVYPSFFFHHYHFPLSHPLSFPIPSTPTPRPTQHRIIPQSCFLLTPPQQTSFWGDIL